MRSIRISADLEREIRAAVDSELYDEQRIALKQVVALLDAVAKPKAAPGLSYQRIIEVLREGLGGRLAVPDNPHVSWIVRQVNRVKELGLDEQRLKALSEVCGRLYPGQKPIELEFILRAAVRLLAEGQKEESGSYVYTGRDDE